MSASRLTCASAANRWRAAVRSILPICAAFLYFAAPTALAQTAPWPAKPVRLIVGTQAGSAPDVIARILAEKLSPIWKQSIIVDNRPGGSGTLAMTLGRSAAPDAYTLILVHAAAGVVTPATYRSANYDIERDFSTIAMIGYSPMGIVANMNAPAKDLAEMIQTSKQAPGKYVLGNPTRTSIPHLASELLNQKSGAKFFNVSFGTPGGIQSVINGDATYYVDGMAALMPMIRGKRVRPIAVFSDTVLPGLEGIPLAKETVPGLTVVGWIALAAPAGLPAPLATRINEDINRVLAMPDVVTRFKDFGTYVKPGTQADAIQYVKSEKLLWGGVLKQAGIERE